LKSGLKKGAAFLTTMIQITGPAHDLNLFPLLKNKISPRISPELYYKITRLAL
jgi:hypothetical protein